MSKKKRQRSKFQNTAVTRDGFSNLVQRSGYGVDNTLSAGTYVPSELISRNRVKLEWMYRQNWVAGAVVDAVAEDMTRAGIEITTGIEPDQIEEIQTYLNRMGVWDALLDTVKWSRLFGGAIAVMQIEGQDMSTPLRMDTIARGQFQGLAVYDRWMLQPTLNEMIESGPLIGLPKYYRVVTSYAASGNPATYGHKIHYSRVGRMIGIKLPPYQAMTEEYWGESVIERMYDRLLAFDTVTMGAANLIDKAHLRMIGINGLREILAAGGPAEENLLTMFSHLRRMQTNDGITLLDKEDMWETSSYSFSGLSDMMLQFNQQLSGSVKIPMVRLFGQSPAGLNSTGESDMNMYHENINSCQESTMRTMIESLLQVAHRSLYGTPLPPDVQFKFTPLKQTDATEKATNAKTIVDTVAVAFDSGLITQSTALKELRQSSSETGVFTNISDEDIDDAEMLPPPAPTTAVSPATPEPAVAPASAMDRIKKWLKGQ